MAQRVSRACQPCPRFKPGQNKSGGWPWDRDALVRPKRLWGAGRRALILPGGAGRGALVSTSKLPCQPWISPQILPFSNNWAFPSVLWAAPWGSAKSNQLSQAINNKLVLPGTKNCYQFTSGLGNRGWASPADSSRVLKTICSHLAILSGIEAEDWAYQRTDTSSFILLCSLYFSFYSNFVSGNFFLMLNFISGKLAILLRKCQDILLMSKINSFPGSTLQSGTANCAYGKVCWL